MRPRSLASARCDAFGWPRFRDQSRAPLPGQVAPEPLDLDAQAVLQLWEKHHVHQRPHQPGDESAQMQAAALEDREVLADHGHGASVVIAERFYDLMAANLCIDNTPYEAAFLSRDLSQARQRMA